MLKRRIIVGLISIFIILICYAVIPKMVFAEGENWLTGWDYRKSHIIEQADNSGTNYQIKIIVDYSNDTDSGDTVYLNEKCEIDFGDIRFTENDGDTELNYWIESKTDSDNATFWVKISDDLDADNVSIYIYYGNSGANYTDDFTDLEHGNNTFVFFDNFDDESFDNDKWVEWLSQGSIGETGGYLWISTPSNVYEGAGSKVEVSFNHAFRFVARMTEQQSVSLGTDSRPVGGGDMDGAIFRNSGGTKYYRSVDNNVDTQNARADAISIDTLIEIQWVSANVSFLINDVIKDTISSNVPDDSCSISSVCYGSGSSAYMDWSVIRKFISYEPVNGAWGEEETFVSTVFITFFTTDGGIFEANSTVKANETITEYDNSSILILRGIVENASYSWFNFTWLDGNSTVNDYSFTVSENDTIWCYFDLSGISGIDENYFVLGFVIAGCSILFVVIVLKSDKKEK